LKGDLKEIIFFVVRWIIDGYNVIFADARIFKILRNNIETARCELLREIQRSTSLAGDKITIVFDGKYNSTSDKTSGDLVVTFSAEGQTADELIKNQIADSTVRSSLRVVTNDLAIIDFARICGVPRSNIIKSEEFLERIRSLAPTQKAPQHTTMKSRKPRAPRSYDSTAEKPMSLGKPDPELLRLFKENRK